MNLGSLWSLWDPLKMYPTQPHFSSWGGWLKSRRDLPNLSCKPTSPSQLPPSSLQAPSKINQPVPRDHNFHTWRPLGSHQNPCATRNNTCIASFLLQSFKCLKSNWGWPNLPESHLPSPYISSIPRDYKLQTLDLSESHQTPSNTMKSFKVKVKF